MCVARTDCRAEGRRVLSRPDRASRPFEQVLDHYEKPRNVGSFDKSDTSVGTGLVGAPACGDVMKLQIRVDENGNIVDSCFKTFGCGSAIASSSVATEWCVGWEGVGLCCLTTGDVRVFTVGWWKLLVFVHKILLINLAASPPLCSVVCRVKGKPVDEVLSIKNSDIAKHLSLPPVKLHCSMLAEDAIKAAVKDWRAKQKPATEADAPRSQAASA